MDEKKSGIQQRCLFVAMLAALLNEGGATALLDGRTSQERKQMAEAWDLYQHTPVGVIFNRPDFENYTNVKQHDTGKSSKKRLTEYSDGRNKRV